MGDQRIDDVLELAADDGIKFIERKVDAMIGHPALREIVGTNSFAPIAAADLALAILGDLVMMLLLHLVEQAGPQDNECLRLVLVL